MPTWGRLLYDAQNFLDLAPHWAIFPGMLIFLTVLSINYIGDGCATRWTREDTITLRGSVHVRLKNEPALARLAHTGDTASTSALAWGGGHGCAVLRPSNDAPPRGAAQGALQFVEGEC